MRGWDQVSEVHHALSAVGEHGDLVTQAVAVGDDQVEAGEKLGITVKQFQLPAVGDGGEIFHPERLGVAQRGVVSVLPAGALDVVRGLGK